MPFTYRLREEGIVRTEWVVDSGNNDTGIVKLTLNNPPVNTLTQQLLAEIARVLNTLRVEPKCLGVLFCTNLHGRANTTKKPIFSPGFDLSVFAKNDPALSKAYLYTVTRTLLAAQTLGKPMIGVMFGQCIAGGAVLPCAFDYRILDSDSKRTMMHFNEAMIGISICQFIFDAVNTAVPANVAASILAQARPMQPKECKEIGVANELFDFEGPADATNAMIQEKMLERGIKVMQSKYFVSGRPEDFVKNAAKIKAAGVARGYFRKEFIALLESDERLDQDLDNLKEGFHNDYIQMVIKQFMKPAKKKKAKL